MRNEPTESLLNGCTTNYGTSVVSSLTAQNEKPRKKGETDIERV